MEVYTVSVQKLPFKVYLLMFGRLNITVLLYTNKHRQSLTKLKRPCKPKNLKTAIYHTYIQNYNEAKIAKKKLVQTGINAANVRMTFTWKRKVSLHKKQVSHLDRILLDLNNFCWKFTSFRSVPHTEKLI